MKKQQTNPARGINDPIGLSPSSLTEEFEQGLETAWPVETWLSVTTIIGVSGGADSVALLQALARIRRSNQRANNVDVSGRLVVAHVNHRLRGEAADGDEELVRELAAQLELPFRSCQGNVDSLDSSIESKCRNERYAFFLELARKDGARYIATAHHRDDQVETLLFRAFRGTSVAGLAGIQPFRKFDEGISLARPLLEFSREQILVYLNSLGQQYRIDKSNQESKFTRNWIRNDLLPQIQERFPMADESLQRLASSANEQTTLLNEWVDEWLEQSVNCVDANHVLIHTDMWREKSEPMVRFALVRLWKRQKWPQQSMTSHHWDRLAKMIFDSQPTKMNCPDSIEAFYESGVLTLQLNE